MLPVWEIAPHPNAFDGERPGNWRQHDIRPFAHRMTPPEHPQAPALLHDWVDDLAALTLVEEYRQSRYSTLRRPRKPSPADEEAATRGRPG